MEFTPDELAGIVGLFGALTAEELTTACQELAYRETGHSVPTAEVKQVLEEAEANYVLVKTTVDDCETFVVGPAAFPGIPEGGRDLPHILELPHRTVNRREIAEELLKELLEEDADLDSDAAIELAYDLESWTNVDASALREHVESLS